MNTTFWRRLSRGRLPQRGFGRYLAGVGVAAALMAGAGYSGRKMLAGAEAGDDHASALSSEPISVSAPLTHARAGQRLFLRNCAQCHGADAQGDEGPGLHHLDWTDKQIATRIRNGKKGQMPAFAGKLSPEDIREVIAYLRTLN